MGCAMTAAGDRQLPNVGKQRYLGDRSAEQLVFLEAVRQYSPKVLADLYNTVFPLHREARRRKQQAVQRGWTFEVVDKAGNMEEAMGAIDIEASGVGRREYTRYFVDGANEEEVRLLKQEAIDERVEKYFPFWQAHYDIETWQSAWDWAARHHFVRGMALDLLKTRKAIRIARWCREQPFWRRTKRLPRHIDFPFNVRTSPEITFGMIRWVKEPFIPWLSRKRPRRRMSPQRAGVRIYRTVRPHERQQHYRRQHHGKGRRQVKVVMIPATIVHAAWFNGGPGDIDVRYVASRR